MIPTSCLLQSGVNSLAMGTFDSPESAPGRVAQRWRKSFCPGSHETPWIQNNTRSAVD